MIDLLLKDTIGQPHGPAIDYLITEFSKRNDISYLYVTHDLQFGFVTHKKDEKKMN